MAEWFNAPVLKTGEGSRPPRVRIPVSPPSTQNAMFHGVFFVRIRSKVLTKILDKQTVTGISCLFTFVKFHARLSATNEKRGSFGIHSRWLQSRRPCAIDQKDHQKCPGRRAPLQTV